MSDRVHISFGNWLKQGRQEAGITQEELAERISCARITVQKIESGQRRPSHQVALLLADFFRIPADERKAFIAFARSGQTASGEIIAGAPWRTSLLRRTNLPDLLTTIIGREEEEAAARGHLLNHKVRLLTLTGPPGVGKTRLALQVASQLVEHFEGGVFLADLSPISDPELVLPVIARALGLKEGAGRPIEEVLLDYVRNKRLLLVLDNFEQVLDATTAVVRLMEGSPWLKVLITSREALHVRGERCYAVPPLGVPDPKQLPALEILATFPSVELFVERAQAATPDFVLTQANAEDVAAICVGLEGLPLAIELAAARTRYLTPRDMQTTLQSRLKLLTGGGRDLPMRHRTLYAAIEWSYNLLDETEQRHFRRLGVFVGGFTLEAAVAIYGVEGNDLLSPELASLADKNLIRVDRQSGTLRFSMLAMIHEYSRKKLEESGEAEALQDHHADYFLLLAQEGRAQLFGANQVVWLDRLERDQGNFRAALTWALQKADVDVALLLSGLLGPFWFIRGYWREGRRWLERALALDRAVEAKVLEEVSEKHEKTAKVTEVQTGIRLERPAQLRAEARATALIYLGMITVEQDDIIRGRALLQQSVELSRKVGYKSNLAWALFQLGMTALYGGNRAEVLSLWQESLAVARESRSRWIIAIVLPLLGDALAREGDYETGIAMMEESLALARASGDRLSIADALTGLAEVARKQGDYERALVYYEEGLTFTRQVGFKSWLARRLSHMGYVLLRLGKHERAAACLLEGLQIAGRELGHKESTALCLVGLAGVAALSGAWGDPERAARLVGAADALIEASGYTLGDTDQLDYDLIASTTKAQLGNETWQKAYDEGRAMIMEQAIEYVL